MQDKIYELSLELLHNQEYFEQIASNMQINYYWSRDWSEAFYIEQAQLGFISTTYDTLEGLVLLPELQFEYGILDFDNLHISTKVKKLIKSDHYKLVFNRDFESVLNDLEKHHYKYNWLKDDYITLMKKLYNNKQKHTNFKLHSIELISKESNIRVAGEIGYTIGSTYTSLSGYSSREKRYNNVGKLQLVLLAKHLQQKGFSFWNLGHPHMEYKKQLGSKIYTREKFLQRWQKATKNSLKDL